MLLSFPFGSGRLHRLLAPVLGIVLVVGACRGAPRDESAGRAGQEAVATGSPARTGPVADPQAEAPRVVFLGDSLTAGLGVSPAEAYPSLVQQKLASAGYPHVVVNAGVSGDTSAGGLRRLDWSLRGDVRVLVVALGGNDGLRGLPVSELEQNLSTIVERAQARQIKVLLAGMEAPPNFGADYTKGFRAVYVHVAQRHHVPLIPFFLEGVAGRSGLNQADGIHPNPAGHRIIADRIWRDLQPLLAQRSTE